MRMRTPLLVSSIVLIPPWASMKASNSGVTIQRHGASASATTVSAAA